MQYSGRNKENMEISKINSVKLKKKILWLSCLKRTIVSILEDFL